MKEHTSLRIDKGVKQALKDEAISEDRSFNNHVERVLTSHISKSKQAHVSKQEYVDDTPKAIYLDRRGRPYNNDDPCKSDL